MKTLLQRGLSLVLLALTPLAQAGRPLATDDAGTTAFGTCQVEAWHERAGAERAAVLAPACGIWHGLELGAETAWPSPHDVVRQEAGLVVKFAPAAWTLHSPVGEWHAGLKLAAGWSQPAGEKWQGRDASLLGLVSLDLAHQLAVHVNLGGVRERGSDAKAGLLNLALMWSPQSCCLVFTEVQTNSNKSVWGGVVTTAGGRWWLLPGALGLDFTVGRERGVPGSTRYTLGLGWYGIGP